MRQRAVTGRYATARALIVLGLVMLPLGCRGGSRDDVEVAVRQVGFDHAVGAPVVVLETREGGRLLPIWIGTPEAEAIARQLQQVTPPRPLTHDLLKDVLDRTGVVLARVRITDLRADTFFATIVLESRGREIEVDSRPSDAIALALRASCPIVVRPELLDRAGAGARAGAASVGVESRIWGLTVQDLTLALADSLGLDDVAGVLVSDVSGAAGASTLQRGDVIVGVDGEPVSSVAALRAMAASGSGTRRLLVRREGTHLKLAIEDPRG